MTNENVRVLNQRALKRLGFAINPNLLHIDSAKFQRSPQEIANRMLILTAVIAASCGFSRAVCLAWLKKNALAQNLSPLEQDFFLQADGIDGEKQLQVEALFALSWAAGIVQKMALGKYCDESLVSHFPDIRENNGIAEFDKKIRLVPENELLRELDVYYCAHWAIQDALISAKQAPGKVHPFVIVWRRHALEWLTTVEDWDTISMDT